MAAARQQVGQLLAYALAMLALCLTAFNLYLLAWIWSSLGAGGDGSGGGGPRWAPQVALKLPGQLTSRKSFEASELRAFSATGSVLISQPSGQQQQQQQDQTQIQINHKNNRLLELDSSPASTTSTIKFPSGLLVRPLAADPTDSAAANGANNLSVWCSPRSRAAAAGCHLTAPTIRLNRPEGVDFGGKSVQTAQIVAGRLHSATAKLSLLSTGRLNLNSPNLTLTALEDVALVSRAGHLILNSRHIDLSHLPATTSSSGPPGSTGEGRRAGKRAYKLCICLSRNRLQPERKQQQQQQQSLPPPQPEDPEGLVFGVRPQLSCAKFSSLVCRPNKEGQATNKKGPLVE